MPYIQKMNSPSTPPPLFSPSTTPTKAATMSNIFNIPWPLSFADAKKQSRRGSHLQQQQQPHTASAMKHLTTLLHNEHALSEHAPPLVAIATALTNEEEVENMERERERETLVIRFNSAYFLCKKERPFSEFSSLLELQVIS